MRDRETEQRMGKVRLLLSTLDDYVPAAKSVDLGDEPGPAPARRVPCEACERQGWVRGRLCLLCDGRGWRRRLNGESAWDEYLELPVAEAVEPQLFSGTDHAAEIRRLDASIRRIQQTLRAKAGVIDRRERFGWEHAREQQERHGSYGELRVQLVRLRSTLEPAWLAVFRTHLSSIEVQLSERDRVYEDVGVDWLQREMRTLKVPPWLLEYEGGRRRQSVAALAERGLQPGAIARRTGIPKQKVRRILRGMAAAA